MVDALNSTETCVGEFLYVLDALFSDNDSITTLSLANETGGIFGSHEKIVGIVKSLQTRNYLVTEQQERICWFLTNEGQKYVDTGSPEYRLVEWMKHKSFEKESFHCMNSLRTAFVDETDVAVGNAIKLGWIKVSKEGDRKMQLTEKTSEPSFRDVLNIALLAIKASDGFEKSIEKALLNNTTPAELTKGPLLYLQDIKKRKLVEMKKLKFYKIFRGPNFCLSLSKPVTDLTAKILAEESWRHKEFKPYNFFASGRRVLRGSIHPLMLVMKQFKHVLTSMGFEEMPTNQYAESSFWCFDSLFMPQQHPARDVQDTFFIKDPAKSDINCLSKEYVDHIKTMHSVGGSGSIGWQYDWSVGESLKNIMRTHTTASSSRMLFKIAQQFKLTGSFSPKRLFSIDRVFRNETLDATHLAEFHQVEGLITDRNLSVKDLMNVLATFYREIGIEKLKFKAAYNPYTEPSMEIFGFHPELQRWIEVGNSGIFRPEMLCPMGFPDDVSVIAWGLSLERPTMIKFGISNIRQLFGHKASIGIS